MVKHVFLLTILLSACVPSLGEGPFTVEISEGVENYSEDIFNAFAQIEEWAGCEVFLPGENGDIEIRTGSTDKPWAAGAHKSWDEFYIEVYTDLHLPTVVFTHELLHLLGFEHVEDNTNIMFPTAYRGGVLNAEQLAHLQSYCN